MDDTDYQSRIAQAIIDFDLDHIEQLTLEALDAGIPAHELVLGGLSVGMSVVGEKYNTGEYFLPELVMCAETMKRSMAILEPRLKSGDQIQTSGTVVIGTVSGDLHDIGKNIVASMLQGSGFEVHDLGVDVPTERFVDSVKTFKPDILGLSALLLTTREQMRDVIKALQEAGVRQEVKVMVGGCPVNQDFAGRIGADAYAPNALDAVRVARALMERPNK
jgi:5-methyltetrahydrofolate--homocysteine methyltransferase